jgi:hypothetical protein
MTEPSAPITTVATQWVTAARLFEMRGHLPTPLFVSDGSEKADPEGFRTAMCRLVSTAHLQGGSDFGNRQQITIEFLDGTPGRMFDPQDMVEVHMIQPGRDLIEGFDA